MDLKTHSIELTKRADLVSPNESAELRCRLAKQLEKAGRYAEAAEVLAEFGVDPNGGPKADGLDPAMAAELFLRSGALAGWNAASGSADDQERAKNLITQSIELFERLGQMTKVAEARGELAVCYWREGAYDEARLHLAAALEVVDEKATDVKAALLIRAAIVEVDSQRFDQASRFYSQAIPLVEKTQDHALQGTFHNGYGLLLRRLATPDNREDYLDRALIEYTAASFHFEQAGNTRYVARVEGNLGYLYFTMGKYSEAHTHLHRARHIFISLKDLGAAAQIDETRTRTLLAQGHTAEAERIIRPAIRVLERAGQQAILAEALATHGVALARLGSHGRARTQFERAIEVAETAGDFEGAARARLSTVEELADKSRAGELISTFRAAVEVLRNSQDPTNITRLMTGAAITFDALERLEGEGEEVPEHAWEGFSLKKYVKASESKVIERALRDAGGSVSKAAKLLGFRHHQSLISLLNNRHKDLINMRSTIRRRRKHIVVKPKGVRSKPSTKSAAV